MKIIQEGNPARLKQTHRFKCFNCGCVFEADNDEYTVDHDDYMPLSHMGCPCCGTICSGTLVKGENTHA